MWVEGKGERERECVCVYVCVSPPLSPSRPPLLALLCHRRQVGEVTSWRQFLKSPQWSLLSSVMSRLGYHGYATLGPEGVAVALWALVTSWGRPEQAVIMAATFAGSAPVTSQLTGEVLWRSAFVCVHAR
jgi:hypothetical protein